MTGPATKAHFLHPSSIVFMLMARIRMYLFPAMLGVLAVAGVGRSLTFWLLIFFFVAISVDLVRLFTLRYFLAEHDLVLRSGLLFREQRTIPYRRIQNIDLLQNPLHRLLQVAEVRVETASGNEPEAVLRVLSLQQVELLKQRLSGEPDDTFDQQSESSKADGQRTLLTIPPRELIKLGLISNRGIVLVSLACGFIYELELYERFDLTSAREVARQANQFSILVGIAIGTLVLIAALIVLRIASVIWYVLRFYDYRLRVDRDGRSLRVSGGLFTKVSATVPKHRIQFVSVHRSWLARWLNRASIRIETAGGAASAEEEAHATMARRWFIPIIDERRIPELLSEIRDGLRWDTAAYDWHGVHPLAGRRLIRKAVLLSLAISLFGLALWRPYGMAWGVIALPALVWHARRYAASLKYARFDQGVIYRSGVLTKKTSFTFFDKVQVVSVSQNPFDRRWQMANLTVDTAAAGPAEHRVRVRLLEDEFAHEELRAINHQAALPT